MHRPQALNHNPEASLNDGTCEYPAPSFEGLVAEPIASNSDGVHLHRLYASFTNPLDELIAVFGDASHPLTITSGRSFLQDSTATSPWEGNDDDSWLSLGGGGTEIQSLGMEVPLANFENGQDLLFQSAAGAMWFVYPGSGWGAPDSLGRVLLGHFASDGLVSVSLNFQYQAQSGETVQVLDATVSFPDLPAGCMLNDAFNFDPSAIVEDGSCDFTVCRLHGCVRLQLQPGPRKTTGCVCSLKRDWIAVAFAWWTPMGMACATISKLKVARQKKRRITIQSPPKTTALV